MAATENVSNVSLGSLAEHGDEVGDAGVAALLVEQGGDLATFAIELARCEALHRKLRR